MIHGGDIGEYSTDGNTVLIVGTGSVWSNSGDLLFGGDFSDGDSLTVADGGKVYNNNFVSGLSDGYGLILVTGSGSEWVAQDLQYDTGDGGGGLVISNGGAIYSTNISFVGDGPEVVTVTGNGSVWNSGSVEIRSLFSEITISDGGAVYSSGVELQNNQSMSLLVAGSNSVWDIQTSLTLEGPPVVLLTVSNGGTVIVGDMQAQDAQITISGGGLYVTNGLGNGSLQVNSGALTFNSGTLVTESTTISIGSVFAVGDGTDAATFQLASGGSGIHSFANGLTISSNSFLTGCGTIEGSVVVNPGGTVVANCGGTLTFTGIVTNNGTMQALNGSVLEAYSNFVNNGIIDIRGGTTNFPGGFINNGIVITTNNFPVITAIQVVGSDIEVSVTTGSGSTYVFEEATNLTGGNWTPIIEFTGPGGVVTFIDSGAATLPQRFYRVGLVPSP
jgi:T5SS/PEP-CTERM-associated repeat protein